MKLVLADYFGYFAIKDDNSLRARIFNWFVVIFFFMIIPMACMFVVLFFLKEIILSLINLPLTKANINETMADAICQVIWLIIIVPTFIAYKKMFPEYSLSNKYTAFIDKYLNKFRKFCLSKMLVHFIAMGILVLICASFDYGIKQFNLVVTWRNLIINHFASQLPDTEIYQEQMINLYNYTKDKNLHLLLLQVFTSSILTPIVEELFYRGMLYGIVRHWISEGITNSYMKERTKMINLIICFVINFIYSAAIFAIVHSPSAIVSAAIGGVIYITLFELTGKLWPSMVSHFLYNTAVSLHLIFLIWK